MPFPKLTDWIIEKCMGVEGGSAGGKLELRKTGEIPPDDQCIKNLKCVGGLKLDESTNLPETEKDRVKQNALNGAT